MTHITWLGHAAFCFEGATGSVLVDPFLTGNPASPGMPAEVVPDAIVVTHGHQDHFGDCVSLASEYDCPIVAVPELAAYCESQGVEKVLRFNFGGSVDVSGIRIRCVPAVHSSSVGPERVYAGNPCGVVLSIDGFTIYHAGDTDVFSDMKLIGAACPIDLALLPIGGTFTMDPASALVAIELLRPAAVSAMHFGTFAAIAQDSVSFAGAVTHRGVADYLALEPGVRTALTTRREP